MVVPSPDSGFLFGYNRSKEKNMPKKSWRILPSSTVGKWSVGLIIAMPLLFITGSSFTDTIYNGVPAGGTIPTDIVARPALALTMLAGMAAGISAFITGLLAINRKKDNAVLVFISSIIGALLLLFIAAELLFPH
jgi:hypothetical protein